MKLICLLISVYILYLVSLPCIDGPSCINDSQVNQTQPHDQSHDSDQHVDGCSPFCICACCSISVVLTAFHFESTPFFSPVHIDFILKEGKSVKYFHRVWEPPKVA